MYAAFIPTDLTGRGGAGGRSSNVPGAGELIMLLFIVSLAVGFAALIVFYLVMRSQTEVWPPAGTPPLPAALWLSTAIILLSSVTMHWTLLAGRRGDARGLRIASLATLALAVAFLVSQAINWGLAVAARMPRTGNMYAVLFYLLTGLHGLHIIGGLTPLAVIARKAWRDGYAPNRTAGIAYCAMYWHFVDVAWLAMYGTLLIR